MITDTVFAEDIALISDNLDKAQWLLDRVETAAPDRVGPHINRSKTEYMANNLRRQGDLTTLYMQSWDKWTISSI